jgi:circadian clock protein KaiC
MLIIPQQHSRMVIRMDNVNTTQSLASTGIQGLDSFICGGLPRNRVYLVEGDPGVGKTTLGFCFLLEGVQQKETVLLVSLAETPDEMRAVAESHGWDLSGITIFNIGPSGYGAEEQYSILQPSEIELSETIKRIFEEVDRVKPTRVVIDSLSEIRLLSQSPLRYRRQILALKQHFSKIQCTVYLLDDRSADTHDLTLQSLVHGVIELRKTSPTYGKARRRIQVVKLRGVDFQAGYHDFNLVKGGIEVFPRLVAANNQIDFKKERVSSTVQELDDVLGGGLDRGTTTLVMGPAGSGKSSIGVLYVHAAVSRGEKAVIYTFDEGVPTLINRASELNMDLRPFIDQGQLVIQQIDPAEMTPGEFMWLVRRKVEDFGARTVLIDSLTGYLDAMPESQFLTIQMHEMLTYLNQHGVLSFLTIAQHGYMGENMHSPADISYLADTVLLLRYFEASGSVKRALSVVKKRSGNHETTIREYRLGPEKITVGHALTEFQGVLTGVPSFIGSKGAMMEPGHGSAKR